MDERDFIPYDAIGMAGVSFNELELNFHAFAQ